MYTKVVRTKQSAPPTELGRFMVQWRQDANLTVEQAAEQIGAVKSTWSNIENGKRKASMETLMALSELTGQSIESLALKEGRLITRSLSSEDRAHRAAALAEVVPAARGLLDLLPDLTPGEIDTLLSVGESLIRQRRDEK